MKQVLNKISFLAITLLGLIFASPAKAVCPVCVVAVGAGLGLSRWLGIDDVVSSIWIGALLLAMTIWTLVEMEKRNWKFKFDKLIIFLAYYLLVLVPLYYSEIIGHPLNKIFGIDRIIFGTAIGTAVLFFGYWLHHYLKGKNGGKSYFPYQKVVLPLVLLILVSLLLYLLVAWKII